jgi:riboflavin synthase
VFTGIIEEVGEVVQVDQHDDSAVLTVRAATITDDLRHGASIAVNGVCLTVTGWTDEQQIAFDVMGETLARTGIGELHPGDRVNLERAVRADARLDGHIVQGHVDATGSITARTPGAAWESVRFSMPTSIAGLVAEKGSIAVDGVSLPETLRATVLGAKPVGAVVNLETDVLAKYVARLAERNA